MLTIKRILKSSSIVLVVILVCFLLMAQGSFKVSSDVVDSPTSMVKTVTYTGSDLVDFLTRVNECKIYYSDTVSNLDWNQANVATTSNGSVAMIHTLFDGSVVFAFQPIGGEDGRFYNSSFRIEFNSTLFDLDLLGMSIDCIVPQYGSFDTGLYNDTSSSNVVVNYTDTVSGSSNSQYITTRNEPVTAVYPIASFGSYSPEGYHVIDSFYTNYTRSEPSYSMGSHGMYLFDPDGLFPFQFNSFSIDCTYINSSALPLTPVFYCIISEISVLVPDATYETIIRNQELVLDYLDKYPNATRDQLLVYLENYENDRTLFDQIIGEMGAAQRDPFNGVSVDDLDDDFYRSIFDPDAYNNLNLPQGLSIIKSGLNVVYENPYLTIILILVIVPMVSGFLLTGKT